MTANPCPSSQRRALFCSHLAPFSFSSELELAMTHHTTHNTTGATGGGLLGHHQTGHHNSHVKTTEKHTTTHHPNGAVTHSTTTGIPKVPMGQKVSGKMDVLIGEMTHNPAKVAIGHAKQDGGVMRPQAH